VNKIVMEKFLFAFWLLVYIGMQARRRDPRHTLSRAALTWFGPIPAAGETLSHFHFRRASYAFGWFVQFALALSLIMEAMAEIPAAKDAGWLMGLNFAMSFGIAMAFLATLGLLCKAAKVRMFGPDGVFYFPELPSNAQAQAPKLDDSEQVM